MFGKVLAGIGKGLLSGAVAGVSSGVQQNVHRGLTKGRQPNMQNAGSHIASTHDAMFDGRAAQRGHEWEMQRMQLDNSVRLQQMQDATAIESQKMQMVHDAMMHSVSKGHKGVGEVIDFLFGKEKSEFFREYRKLMNKHNLTH